MLLANCLNSYCAISKFQLKTTSNLGEETMIELTYRQEGEVLLPNIGLPPEPEYPINKYGRMRNRYLKDHRDLLFTHLLLTGKLQEHISEVSRMADERLERMMQELEAKFPPPDKATDQMGWVGHMNGLKHQAEEVIFAELIYS
jgi:hypothetical protein